MCECVVLIEVRPNEVELLRVMRNECKAFMTRYTEDILYEQQQEWYRNLDKSKNKIYILHQIHYGVVAEPIGYGYIRVEDGFVLLTGGLTESKRGKGYGSSLFNFLIQNSKQFKLPIKLEVLKTNTVAFSIYKKLGFNIVSENDNVITMEYHYDSVI